MVYLRVTIGVVIEPTGQVITFVIPSTTAHIKIKQDTRGLLADPPDTNLTMALVVPDHPGAREAGLNVANSSI